MIPVHFGRKDRLLFGLYTPARGRRRQRGVLLCNPFGDESLRAHRSLRSLTELLANSGLDVFRFDYYGTGDSMGDDLDVTLSGWIEDTEMAVEELRGMASVRQMSIVGLRLGALAAAETAARRPREVDRVVLWEPVLEGTAQLAELGAPTHAAAGPIEARGFVMSPRLVEELAAARATLMFGPRCRILVAVSDRAEYSGLAELTGRKAEIAELESPRCWVEDRDYGAGAVPRAMLARIAEWLN